MVAPRLVIAAYICSYRACWHWSGARLRHKHGFSNCEYQTRRHYPAFGCWLEPTFSLSIGNSDSSYPSLRLRDRLRPPLPAPTEHSYSKRSEFLDVGRAPTGRPAGAIGWTGLANTFFWIDRKNGFGGYWATQILPFGDPVSFGGYLDFETAAYATGEGRQAA
jgi:hypothetical protein